MLFLDSADPDAVRRAGELGFVRGVTTNPSLMARHTHDPLGHLKVLLELFAAGPIMYQPNDDSVLDVERAAMSATELDPDRVVVKLPASLDHIALACRLRSRDVRCAITAVFSPAQAFLASESGCEWIIPYVDRACSDPRGHPAIVRGLAAILTRLATEAKILAAGIKSVGQALLAIEDGAHGISVPLEIISALSRHPMTEEAIEQFRVAVHPCTSSKGRNSP